MRCTRVMKSNLSTSIHTCASCSEQPYDVGINHDLRHFSNLVKIKFNCILTGLFKAFQPGLTMQLNLARPVPDMRLDVVLMEGHLAAAPPRAPDTIYPIYQLLCGIITQVPYLISESNHWMKFMRFWYIVDCRVYSNLQHIKILSNWHWSLS